MLGFPSDTLHEAKCIVTHGTMGHLDPKQPPTKRKPFASILNHHFIQKVCYTSSQVATTKPRSIGGTYSPRRDLSDY